MNSDLADDILFELSICNKKSEKICALNTNCII